MAICESCRAPIQWLKNRDTGSVAPVDIEPVENGNVAVIGGQYKVKSNQADLFGFDEELTYDRVLHFVTCPDADRWRSCRKCHHAPCVCAD